VGDGFRRRRRPSRRIDGPLKPLVHKTGDQIHEATRSFRCRSAARGRRDQRAGGGSLRRLDDRGTSKRAGLVGALSRNRQVTVFAPTDAAFSRLFAALGVSGVDEIPLGTLRSVLLHHVAPGSRYSDDVLGSTRIRTLNRDFVRPHLVAGVPYVDGARIVAADIAASNGVIHVIDAVLLPGS
jgi:Fasciclin domain